MSSDASKVRRWRDGKSPSTQTMPIPTSRKLLYTTIVVAGVLGILNATIWKAEESGLIETRRPDDMVHHVDDALFVQDGAYWITTSYAEKTMVPMRVPVERDSRSYRLVIVGGSFAMGTPYSHQRHGEERPGGIASWLRADLTARFPDHKIEVINLAAGGQSSTRVTHIVDDLTVLKPDVVVVASCNNESSLTPNVVEEELRQFAGVRLLSKLLRPPPENSARPELYSPQDTDSLTLKRRFENNLRTILTQGKREGFEVLLSTLPVHLTYQGDIPGGMLLRDEDGGSMRAVSNECKGADCPHNIISECAQQGAALLQQGQTEAARGVLEECEDLEALRWMGMLELNSGDIDRGVSLLEQYTELVPRGRCRPSFNKLIRDVAPEGRLVDLQNAVLNEGGLTPAELFVDNCHLSWVGYALMAQTVLSTLREADLLPSGEEVEPSSESVYQKAQKLGLPAVVGMDRVGGPAIPRSQLADPRDPWGERPAGKPKAGQLRR